MILTPALAEAARPLDASALIARLDAEVVAGQALVCCPAHEDRSPSLRIGAKVDGSVLVHCYAGCDYADVHSALRRLVRDPSALADYNGRSYAANRSRFVEYDPPERYAYSAGVYKAAGRRVYTEPGGKEVTVRERTKCWVDERGHPCSGAADWYVPPGLDLTAAGIVHVVSSESDADALAGVGLAAVSVPNGDSGGLPDGRPWSGGAQLVVIGDNDDSGRRWAARASEALGCPSVHPPEPHGDARDAILAGETAVESWGAHPGAHRPADPEFEAMVAAERRMLKARRVAREQDEAERRDEMDGLDDQAMEERSMSPAQVRALPSLRYVLEGLLPEDNVAVLAGQEATFKSFVAFDWAAHIAVGRDWHGRNVRGGHAAIVAAEGGAGYGQRLRAWERQHGREIPDDALTVYPDRVDMSSPGTADSLTRWLRRRGAVRLLVVDTLRKVSGSADENSAREMGAVLDSLDQVRKALPGIAVLVIHHNNKGGGMRGSSAIAGDLDTVLSVKRGAGLVTSLRVDKQKDGRDGFALSVTLAPVETGDGDASLAVVAVRESAESEETDGVGANVRTLPIIRRAGATGIGQTEIAEALGGRDKYKGIVSEDVKYLVRAGRVAAASKPPGAKSRSQNWWVALDDG